MRITWYGHSCFKIEAGDVSVVFDPYRPGSVPGLELPPLTADVCVCSHGHDDHFYPQGVTRTGRDPVLPTTQLATYHDDQRGALRGKNLVTLLELGGVRAVHLGDLGHPLSHAQIARLGRVDVLMIPVGGFYTIDAAAAASVRDALHPSLTLPMHYRGDGFGMDVLSTVDDFLRLCDNAETPDTNVVDFSAAARPRTVMLKCPLKGRP
ncbi:MAG TPA: MBL fold metallo-hydrolase [Oscillospiraceae bacterium]|nr:MBL fold metallo-hydrolase [Oscillospiraceae bacterium]